MWVNKAQGMSQPLKFAIKEVGFRGAIMKGQWVRVRVR